MTRILITGGAGFIGSHLAAACLGKGHEVHVVTRKGSRVDRLQPFAGRIARHVFDLRSDDDIRRCIADVEPELIYHLAANPRRPAEGSLGDVRANIDEDLQSLVGLLAAAMEARRPPSAFVRAGSLAEYGLAPAPYREDVREAPVTVYGAGMVAATHYASALQPRLPFPVITGRLALVYGPAQSTEYLLPTLIVNCLNGTPSRVRRPDDRRDLLYIDDAVEAFLCLGTMPLAGGTIVNIASGKAPTMREVARQVVEKTGADPGLIAYGDGSPPTGATDLRGAWERAYDLTGWRARTGLGEGIARTVDAYRMPARSPEEIAEIPASRPSGHVASGSGAAREDMTARAAKHAGETKCV